MPEAIRAYRQRRPEFRYQLHDADAAVLTERVTAGTLDVAFGVFLAHMPGVRRTPLFRFSMYAIGARGRPDAARGLSWASLKGQTLISLQPSIPLQRLIDKHLARAGVPDQPRVVVNSFRTVIALAEAGEGVGIIPSYWLPVRSAKTVVAARLSNPVLQLDFHQIRRSGRRLPPDAEAFVTFQRDYIADWAERSRIRSS